MIGSGVGSVEPSARFGSRSVRLSRVGAGGFGGSGELMTSASELLTSAVAPTRLGSVLCEAGRVVGLNPIQTNPI